MFSNLAYCHYETTANGRRPRRERAHFVKQIDLSDLGAGKVPNLPPSIGIAHEQAAVVKLELSGHSQMVVLDLIGGATKKYSIVWNSVSKQIRDFLENGDRTTEDGAIGIAFFIIVSETDFAVAAVHGKAGGGGFDYWLVEKGASEFSARLEIAGRSRASPTTLRREVRKKTRPDKPF